MNQTTINHANLKYDVLVEKNCEKGYTARVLAWPECVATATTREEALKQVRGDLLIRLAKADIVALEFTAEEVNNPWLKFAGMWKDNPDFDEFQAEIQRYRREIDAELAPWLFEPEEELPAQPEEEAVFA